MGGIEMELEDQRERERRELLYSLTKEKERGS